MMVFYLKNTRIKNQFWLTIDIRVHWKLRISSNLRMYSTCLECSEW